MELVRADAMFRLYPAKVVHKQKVKLTPVEHHYENDGETPYIKYSCRLCEQLANAVSGLPLEDEDGSESQFIRFSFPEGTPNCPCCGVNIDWDYTQFK